MLLGVPMMGAPRVATNDDMTAELVAEHTMEMLGA